MARREVLWTLRAAYLAACTAVRIGHSRFSRRLVSLDRIVDSSEGLQAGHLERALDWSVPLLLECLVTTQLWRAVRKPWWDCWNQSLFELPREHVW